MSLFEALVLAVVQGLTEFLPVSSSGHLVLFSAFLRLDDPTIIYEVLVHFGTLLAVLVAFRDDISQLWAAFWFCIRCPRKAAQAWHRPGHVRLLGLLLIATVPTVVVGLLIKDWIGKLFDAPYLAGLMLIVTGTIIYVTARNDSGTKSLERVGIWDSLIVGLGQSLAILPGISRSGATIGFGLWRGMQREAAARFSFLLSIPAILGGMVFALADLITGSGGTSTPLWILALGTLTSAFTGYLAIRLLLNYVRKGKLVWFAYYTWALGGLIVTKWLLAL